MKILALDIAMTNTGVAVLELTTGQEKFDLIDAVVIATEKLETGEQVSGTVDGVRRAAKVASEVWKRHQAHEPDLVVVEAMSWPRNAASAIKMALVWGALAPILAKATLIEVGPQAIKLAAAGSRSATKAQVEEGVRQKALRHPAAAQDLLQLLVPKRAQREHFWDAAGAAWAATQTEKFRLLRTGARLRG